MRILVNAMPMEQPLSGVGQYTRCLYQALERIEPDCLYFYGYHWSSTLSAGCPDQEPWSRRILRSMGRGRRSGGVVRRMVFLSGMKSFKPSQAVYHEPNFLPYPSPLPTVLTVHDLSPLSHPETHRADYVETFKARFPIALNRARRVLVVSEFTRNELIRWFPRTASKISVTPNGLRDQFRPLAEETARACLDGLKLSWKHYILTVGTLEPRKNLGRAIAAYQALPETVRREIPLVIAGQQGWLNAALEETLARFKGPGTIRILGFVEDQHLNALYSGAQVFLYPSIYEGFGLPPLEAMASGTPVVAGNQSSLPEVIGDAGLLVDPFSVDGIADGLLQLIENQTLRTQLREQGLRRAGLFTWERTARLTQEAFLSAL